MLNRMRLRFLPNFSEIPAETKRPRILDGWFRLTGMLGFSRKLTLLRDLTQPGDLVEIHQDAGGVLSLQLGQSDGEEGGHGAVSEDWQHHHGGGHQQPEDTRLLLDSQHQRAPLLGHGGGTSVTRRD